MRHFCRNRSRPKTSPAKYGAFSRRSAAERRIKHELVHGTRLTQSGTNSAQQSVLMADSAIPQSTATRGRPKDYMRRLPIGAESIGAGRTHFRVWAPDAPRVSVVVDGRGTT